jgi:tetratricopeptide (TPR) repeat protein
MTPRRHTDARIRWLAPVCLGAMLITGAPLVRAESPPPALAELEAAARARPTDVPALVELGRSYAERGRIADALALLERAVTLEPKNPAARVWLGSVQVRMARTTQDPGAQLQWVKKGTRTMDEAVEEFPDVPIVYLVRGMTGVQLPDQFRRYRLSIRDFTTLLERKAKGAVSLPDAQMALVYLNLGLAYKKNDQKAEARAAWDQGRRLYPRAPETRLMERELNGW